MCALFPVRCMDHRIYFPESTHNGVGGGLRHWDVVDGGSRQVVVVRIVPAGVCIGRPILDNVIGTTGGSSKTSRWNWVGIRAPTSNRTALEL